MAETLPDRHLSVFRRWKFLSLMPMADWLGLRVTPEQQSIWEQECAGGMWSFVFRRGSVVGIFCAVLYCLEYAARVSHQSWSLGTLCLANAEQALWSCASELNPANAKVSRVPVKRDFRPPDLILTSCLRSYARNPRACVPRAPIPDRGRGYIRDHRYAARRTRNRGLSMHEDCSRTRRYFRARS